MVCLPLLSRSLDLGSLTSFGRHTGTPPTALVIDLKPLKSTCMKWSMRMLEMLSIVFITQDAPPVVNAELIWARDKAGAVPPFLVLQAGSRTIRSRGKLIPIACPPPGDRCSRIMVSERG